MSLRSEIMVAVAEAILSTNGKFFAISFLTKAGEERTKTVRIGVASDGGKNTVEHKPEYIKVYVVGEKKWNNVNLENVMSIKCGNKSYSF